MSVPVRIPGADSIQEVAPTRDPGVQATPEEFGAGVGASAANFGAAAVSLGAHLYEKRKAAEDQTFEQTYNVNAAPALQKAEYDARKAFPDGGPGYMEDLNTRAQQAHQGILDALSQRGITPSDTALRRVNTQFAGRQANLLVSGVTYDNNAQVAKLQAQTGDNVKTVASQVLSGNLDVDEAVKQVDGITASAGSLYTGGALSAFKKQARDVVYQAAVDSAIASKDTARANELNARFFGTVPKGQRDAVSTAMEYFQSTGKTKEQAAGIVGNLDHESGFNTSASGDNGTAFGIAQWRGERLDALKAYAASQGKPITDLQTQLQFVDKELNSTEGKAHEKLLAAKSTDEAAKAFIDYERPQGFGTANPHGLSNRIGLARSASGEAASAESPSVSVALTNNNKIQSMDGVNRADVTSAVADDLASMQATGVGDPALSADKVAKSLGPNAAQDWQTARIRAKDFYDQTQDFSTLPADQMNARIQRLAAKPGQEEFVAQDAMHTAAIAKATAIMEQRKKDPAASVNDDPQVKQAIAAADPKNPATMQAIITARLAAQQRAGISAPAPIPVDETQRLLKPITEAAQLEEAARSPRGQPNRIVLAQQQLVKNLKDQYGPYADAVMTEVIGQATNRRERLDQAAAAGEVMAALINGTAPGAKPVRQVKVAAENNAASKGFFDSMGDFLRADHSLSSTPSQQTPAKVPSSQSVQILLNAPASDQARLAGLFNKQFGDGSAEKILAQKVAPTVAPKGTVTITNDGESYTPE